MCRFDGFDRFEEFCERFARSRWFRVAKYKRRGEVGPIERPPS